MIEAAEIIDNFAKGGYKLSLDQGFIHCKPKPNENLIQELKLHKLEIIAYLENKKLPPVIIQHSPETNKTKESTPCSDEKNFSSAGKSELLPDLLTLNKTIFDLSSRLIQLSAGVSSGSDRYKKIDQAFTYLQDVENFEDPQNTIETINKGISKAMEIIEKLHTDIEVEQKEEKTTAGLNFIDDLMAA